MADGFPPTYPVPLWLHRPLPAGLSKPLIGASETEKRHPLRAVARRSCLRLAEATCLRR